jgi:ABC-type lipoprotein export system ATPase subunit
MVVLVAHDGRFIPFADRVYTVKNGSIEQTHEARKDEGPTFASNRESKKSISTGA